ncbi:uncharacterized protein LOC128224179 [Mya arenaria]|uniref:uncharacterized protein LOC128224179 n=1 Tax=Mya arenaria TaxID=6604 RepID=UPI0022E75012|nr:uncharacterized protein LOC128224179 [Mya arenaria]
MSSNIFRVVVCYMAVVCTFDSIGPKFVQGGWRGECVRQPCEWTPWKPWSECSRTCGGGTKSRSRSFCCRTAFENANDGCVRSCGKNPDGFHEHSDCNDWCYNGGWVSSNGCSCPDNAYYGFCCDSVCPSIAECKYRSCTASYNVYCKECNDDNVFFKRYNSDKECQRMCSWNNHYCWPGSCRNGLTKDCLCAAGFSIVSDSWETSCQPTKKPSILTCDTVVIGPNGEKKRAMSSSSSTACQYLQDMYGNYQPTTVKFDLSSEYTIYIPYSSHPSHIAEERFGITDATVYMQRQSVSGSFTTLSTNRRLTYSSQSVKSVHHDKDTLTTSHTFQNGQALCLQYEVKGGGYLKAKDTHHTVYSAKPYRKNVEQRTVCYRYDSQPPEHCSKLSTCDSDPLYFDKRITRAYFHKVEFEGWVDPVPQGGVLRTASSIESYEIRVNEVLPSKGTLKVDYTTNVLSTMVNHTVTNMYLNLTSVAPRLYCLTLEVKDVADNVRQCRRFILYDNTSSIQIWNEKPFRFTSSSPDTDYTWQTHHNDVCISWKDYFYNDFYIHNELLNPIEPDPHGLITGSYEQITGEIPASGTTNVYGIIAYHVFWSKNHGSFSVEKPVPSFTNQSFCIDLNVKDGETYTLKVKAIDIVGNTLSDNLTVFIDRSVPHLNNIWLERDGYKMLYVHNSTDLSKMKMTFDALDPHSGLSKIHWTFGIADTMTELLSEHLAVFSINDSCSSAQCYCPDIGECAFFNYTIPLNRLNAKDMHIGNHNRNYYFTLKVTNKAGLSTTEHIDVLVDDSPPSVGVVYEGPEDSPDIDYTSDDSILVHWHGFIDHESAIKLYRVGLSNRCLSTQDLFNLTEVRSISIFRELPFYEESVRIPTTFTGKRFVTVIALNNAMEPSNPVCSDGVTRDLSPPEFRNMTLQHGQLSESLICLHGEVYVMQTNMQRAKLHNTSVCQSVCGDDVESHKITEIFQIDEIKEKDEDISSFLCEHLPLYTNDILIYLPNDKIFITWDVEEVGSQIDDFFVGLGVGPTEKTSPSIVAYQSTQKKTYFKRKHEGLGSDELFYIFVKVINKAGLERIATIGPVLIDQTPPLNRTLPQVIVESEHIVFGWDSNTFYDEEQTAQIDQIYFQIAYNGTATTPFLEWRLDTSSPCPSYSGGCFRYPLRSLQLQDTDNNLEFYINMHVYNNAGHYLSVTSQPFQLSSRYPPGQTVISDIDPSVKNSNMDVDAHFTKEVLCASWQGFLHQDKLALEVGVGLSNATDDVLNFQLISNSNSYCIHSIDIRPHIKYVFLLRSYGTGGVSVSFSDGIMVLDKDEITHSLSVSIGYDCTSQIANTYHFTLANNSARVTINKPLHVGQRYIINTPYKAVVTSDDGIVSADGNETFIRPFVNRPALVIEVENQTIERDVLVFYLTLCPVQNVLPQAKQLVVSWKFLPEHLASLYKNVELAYNVGVSERDSILGEQKTFIVPFQPQINSSYAILKELNLISSQKYIAEVQVCLKLECVKPVQSNEFSFERLLNPVLRINEASLLLGGTCVQVKLHWSVEDNDIVTAFYQWTLAHDAEGRRTLFTWKSITNDSIDITVEDCVVLPVHGHISSYACIKAYSISGQLMSSCKKLTKLDFGTYDANVVYDFDTRSGSWTQIQSIIHSSDVGDMYTILHDNELDFGTSKLRPAAAVMHANERNVIWYLMTSRHVPDECDTDVDCLTKKVTTDGFAIFNETDVFLDTPFYLCVSSNTTVVEREWFSETLGEIRSCSDGFILSNTAPIPGKINVQNVNGYIPDIDHVVITWEPFNKETGATLLGYPDNIQHYAIGVGNSPKRDDIVSFRNTGGETAAVLSLPAIADGTSVYFTINGSDHFEHSSVAVSTVFVTDTSPPKEGIIHFDQQHAYYSSDTINIRLVGFYDDHSGISYYNVGIGSSGIMVDTLSMAKYYSDILDIDLRELNILDGHEYFILVQAINNADIPSAIVSKQFIVDRSPPYGGHVLDGNWESKVDLDYQADTYTIRANWKDFSDIESDIEYYKVGLGTDPLSTDVRSFMDVGLKQDIMWNGPFITGEKYYTTVQSCNKAGLCTQKSSDGIILDNSPPIMGRVQAGSGVRHSRYLPLNTSLRIQWAGFEDPQSDINHFEVCLGRQKSMCDIVPTSNALLQSYMIKSNISLPINMPIFATVWAFNGVGMNVSSASDAILVDITAPYNRIKPSIMLEYNTITNNSAQWEKSIISVFWEFLDNESPILNHELSLFTHHEGHTPFERVHIGSEKHYTINLDGRNWLHNGDNYFIVITSCNAAGLCSTERTNDILIDSTPPHQGGLKPQMLWENYRDTSGLHSNVSITWYGFYDQESGIDRYYVTVSRYFSKQELSGGVLIQNHENSSVEQHGNFTLQEALKPDDLIIVSVWTTNSVGLNSSVARVSLFALSSMPSSVNIENQRGILELEKHSCDVHFCNKDCTCAVVGKPCIEAETNMSCVEIDAFNSTDSDLTRFVVFGGLHSKPLTLTASSACLAGHWTKIEHSRKDPDIHRFEWSIGIHNQPHGEGIFDLQKEFPWVDIGLRQEFVHCLPINRSLIHGELYDIYVKTWYGPSKFAIFTSESIKIDLTPPNVRRGRYIIEGMDDCSTDLDFIYWTGQISACWSGVFSEQQSDIHHYLVALGASPNVDDVFKSENMGLKTNISIGNLTLEHAVRYYFTVTAVNTAGLHTSVSSDGFIIDTTPPSDGVVYNTNAYKNVAYQSSVTSLGISWHGFQDHCSGIKSYYVAVGEKHEPPYSSTNFTQVYLKTSVTFKDLNLLPGSVYYGVVKAIDAAGHESDVIVSPGVIIDSSPPKGYNCDQFEDTGVTELLDDSKNNWTKTVVAKLDKDEVYKIEGSIKNTFVDSVILQINRFMTRIQTALNHKQIADFSYTFVSIEKGAQNITISVENNINNFKNILETIHLQRCVSFIENKTKALHVQQIRHDSVDVTAMIQDKESDLKMVHIGAGSTPGGFQIQPLTAIHANIMSVIVKGHLVHAMKVYTTVIAENNAGLTSVFKSTEPIIIDHTSPIITDLEALATVVYVNESGEIDSRVQINATWNALDDESDIKQCTCSIGMLPNNNNIQEQWYADTLSSCESNLLQLQHGDKVWVNINCVNNVDLATTKTVASNTVSIDVISSNQATVNILPVNEGLISSIPLTVGPTKIQSNTSLVQISWSGFEDTSGIDFYEYCISDERNATIVDWTNVLLKTVATARGLTLHNTETLNVSVRATNTGHHRSEAVHASFFTISQPPALSGSPMFVTRNEHLIHIDWEQAFDTLPEIPVVYSLVVGSREGFTDILDIAYYSGHTYDIVAPSSTLISPKITELFFTITCTYPTGMSSVYRTIFTL